MLNNSQIAHKRLHFSTLQPRRLSLLSRASWPGHHSGPKGRSAPCALRNSCEDTRHNIYKRLRPIAHTYFAGPTFLSLRNITLLPLSGGRQLAYQHNNPAISHIYHDDFHRSTRVQYGTRRL
ncbi:hypothetical protein WAI453_009916 [Rhynchosporium graminicola]